MSKIENVSDLKPGDIIYSGYMAPTDDEYVPIRTFDDLAKQASRYVVIATSATRAFVVNTNPELINKDQTYVAGLEWQDLSCYSRSLKTALRDEIANNLEWFEQALKVLEGSKP